MPYVAVITRVREYMEGECIEQPVRFVKASEAWHYLASHRTMAEANAGITASSKYVSELRERAIFTQDVEAWAEGRDLLIKTDCEGWVYVPKPGINDGKWEFCYAVYYAGSYWPPYQTEAIW